MEYKGVEYAIHARPGASEWSWTIYPKNAPAVRGETKGTRQLAATAARRAIDRWLKNHPTQK